MTWMVPFFIASMSMYAPGGFDNGIDNIILDTNIEVGAEWFDMINTSASIQTFMLPPGDGYSFSPYQAYYYVNVDVHKWGVSVGYEHLCRHPIDIAGVNMEKEYGGYDRLYIEYTTRFNDGDK